MSIKRAEPAFGQACQRPLVFGHQLVNHISVLQLRRKNCPGVSFHFQMRAEPWITLQHIQNSKQMICGIAEAGRRWTMKRDMEMNPPLGVGGSRLCGVSGNDFAFPGKSVVKIAINQPISIRTPNHDLVKVNRFYKSGERASILSRRPDLQRGAEMKFADLDSIAKQ